MKRILVFSILMVTATSIFAQQDSIKNEVQKRSAEIGQTGDNELKLNLLLSVVGLPEFTYERLVEDNMGVGLSVAVGIGNANAFGDNYKFLATPYFRLYFGDKKANGFFIEGNAAIVNVTYNTDRSIFGIDKNGKILNSTFFGLGAAVGKKFLTRNGFMGEIVGGVGRLFGDNNSPGAYPRLGVSIGKRF